MTATFNYRDRVLYCEDVPMPKVAEEVGTPLYLYSFEEIRRRYRQFHRALDSNNGLVCYALKANSSKAIISLLSREGAGGDVVSGGELIKSLESGIPPKKIVFAGVGKSEAEIKLALKKGILGLNVESLAELRTVGKIAKELSLEAPVGIRIKPDLAPETHPYLTTGGRVNKFGITRDKAFSAMDFINDSENLGLVGIHAHLGSQIKSTEPYEKLGKFLSRFLEELVDQGSDVDYVDFGGGFGISEKINERDSLPSINDFLTSLLNSFDHKTGDHRILVEPGRSIVGPAGVLIGNVIRRKENDRTFLITDVGMNDFLRPALYGSRHEIRGLNQNHGVAGLEVVDMVGPVCESGDFIARGRELDRLEKGDNFAIFSAGAYGMSMASNYNSRRRPPEVMVRGADYEIIRERETYRQLSTGERAPTFL